MQNGINVIDYKSFFRGKNLLPSFIRNQIEKIEIRFITKLAAVSDWNMVWSFDPFRFQDLSLFNCRRSIFFSADIHQTKLDLILAKNVDLVIAPSMAILKKYYDIAPKTNYINHGVAEHFISYHYSDWIAKGKIEVVYVGNLLQQYIDISTLGQIINEHPEVIFTFIGPYAKSNLSNENKTQELILFLESKTNVRLIGSKQSKTLPTYLDNADLFLICYNSEKYEKEVSNSHKILEYLSSGKVVVANYTSTYKDSDELIIMAEKQAHLPKLFNDVINNLEYYNSKRLQERRRKFALDNTYRKHIDKILKLIEN